ncbi:DUF4123 domain-containing protein [Salinicola aestuarinus]|uniref:DUF4123 domain-containing protein n=1 Tax=Salinicola aestuarinus TaxID=1949082 RepID=UPI000DA23D93|nr:DUF4123 domain-containing protein [Salinicola aestuarinus]
MASDIAPAVVSSAEALDGSDQLRQWRFALINPLLVHVRDWQDLPVRSLQTTPAPARPHRLPQLVDISGVPENQLNDVFARVRRYRRRGVPFYSALLTGKGSVDDIAHHLCRQLLQRRRGDHQYHWFRYYDPLVFRHLTWLMTSKQLARLLGPISHWSWPDPFGNWYTLERPELKAKTTIDWLELRDEQWASIDRFADLNRGSRRLALLAPDWPQNTAHWQWLDDALCHAKRSGLPSEDQPLLAERAAMHLPELARQDEVERFMARAARRLAETGGHLDAWHDAEWNTLTSELRSGHE